MFIHVDHTFYTAIYITFIIHSLSTSLEKKSNTNFSFLVPKQIKDDFKFGYLGIETKV